MLKEFGIGRETLREAIRMLQIRGSIQGVRGRSGGMVLADPDPARIAATFAIHLRILGCEESQVRTAVDTLAGLGCDAGHPLFVVAAQVLRCFENFRSSETEPDGKSAPRPSDDDATFPETRAFRLAMKLASDLSCLQDTSEQTRLGTEAELAEQHAASHETMRQALRILADLDLVETRKGRNGGVYAKRPQPVGMIRQFFSLLSASHITLAVASSMIQLLNRAHLELAIARIEQLPPDVLDLLHQEARENLDTHAEPMRYAMIQELIGRIADNPLIDIMVRSMVAHHMRTHPEPHFGTSVDQALAIVERGQVKAFFAKDWPTVRQTLAAGHGIMFAVLPDAPVSHAYQAIDVTEVSHSAVNGPLFGQASPC